MESSMNRLIKVTLSGLILSVLSACSNIDSSWNVDNSWCPPEVNVGSDINTKVPLKEETHTLSADALFKFDKFTLNAILPSAQENLDMFIRSLQDNAENIVSITVIGHTDRLGTDAYNYQLGLKRAKTIKDLLIRQGITAPIDARSEGRRQPVSKDCVGQGASLKACLQPDRRIEIKITYK